MFSIMEAVEAARQRNAEADARRLARRKRLEEEAAMQIQPILPIQPITSGGDGDGGDMVEDNRTPQEKYRDAINMNKWVGAIPVVGTGIGLMNDAYIQEYERQNPTQIGYGQRYSTVGRLLGFGDPGTTGIGGVFGQNSDLWNAGMFPIDGDSDNAATGNVGYRGDAYRAEIGGGMGPSWSGPQENDGYDPGGAENETGYGTPF